MSDPATVRPEAPAGGTPTAADPDAAPRSLSPRIQRVWQLSTLASALIVLVVLVGLCVLTDDVARLVSGALAVATVAAAALGVLVLVPRRYRGWRYVLGPAALELAHGVLTHRSSTVPYIRVQHIDLTAGPLDRRLGLTTLVIRTASATTDARLPGIEDREAERLRAAILHRAGLDDAA
jgi:membrane protein YdbS with pleckstrin-like domain